MGKVSSFRDFESRLNELCCDISNAMLDEGEGVKGQAGESWELLKDCLAEYLDCSREDVNLAQAASVHAIQTRQRLPEFDRDRAEAWEAFLASRVIETWVAVGPGLRFSMRGTNCSMVMMRLTSCYTGVAAGHLYELLMELLPSRSRGWSLAAQVEGMRAVRGYLKQGRPVS